MTKTLYLLRCSLVAAEYCNRSFAMKFMNSVRDIAIFNASLSNSPFSHASRLYRFEPLVISNRYAGLSLKYISTFAFIYKCASFRKSRMISSSSVPLCCNIANIVFAFAGEIDLLSFVNRQHKVD